MTKFKIGDVITATEKDRGFERATVLGFITVNKGKYKGQKLYQLRIPNGIATVPIHIVEECYKLLEE